MDASPDLDASARDLVVTLRGEATRTGTENPHALARQLYADLHRLARSHRARWNGNATMNTTAIVHEAYLKLADARPENPGHFLGIASRAMRQVLINYARDRSAAKRGGGLPDVSFDDAPPDALLTESQVSGVLGLDDALSRLAALDPRAARVVEMKVYGGATLNEIADALVTSQATVTRDWRRARAWLRGELDETPILPIP